MSCSMPTEYGPNVISTLPNSAAVNETNLRVTGRSLILSHVTTCAEELLKRKKKRKASVSEDNHTLQVEHLVWNLKIIQMK